MSDFTKKVKIQTFKKMEKMTEKDAEELWKGLDSAFNEIYNRNSTSLSYEAIYRMGYNLVLGKYGQFLYDRVKQKICHRLDVTSARIAATPNDRLLHVLLEEWTDHKVTIQKICDVLMYAEKTFIPTYKLLNVMDMGHIAFRDGIVRSEPIRDRIQTLLLAAIASERNGDIIDHSIMKGILRMLVELSIHGDHSYENIFESAFLERTQEFYRQESLSYINTHTCSDYVIKATNRFAEESRRVERYLHLSTEAKLRRLLEQELVIAHATTLIEADTGCSIMFVDAKLDELTALYNLLSRVPATLQLLRDCMARMIREAGNAIGEAQGSVRDPVSFVQQLLDLKAKYDMITSVCFANDNKCLLVIRDAFEEIINKDLRIAYLSHYIDNLFRVLSKDLNEIEIEAKLDSFMILFRFLHNKDIFENYYKNHLSKRLIHRSFNEDLERSLIGRLKSECGCQYTSKMEGMFTDIKISKGLMEKYRDTHFFRSSVVDMDVTVVTGGYWPYSPQVAECVLPESIMGCYHDFTAYYLNANNGRKLTWLFNIGSAELKCNFPLGKRELSVSSYQMIILMLFNTRDSISFREICDNTKIPDADCHRHIMSLSTPKCRILIRSNQNNEEIFSFNPEFTSKLRRIKVPLIASKETVKEDTNAVPPAVEEDRKHIVEAAIVRIMKARKRLTHNDLMQEVMRQVMSRFSVDPPFIKKRIESLIEREYLDRDANNRSMYNYLA